MKEPNGGQGFKKRIKEKMSAKLNLEKNSTSESGN